MRGAVIDDYDEPIHWLRYEEVISTRDVADLLRVTPAAVRRWVTLGYIRPVSRTGASNVFNTQDVLVAFEAIRARRKATGSVGGAARSGNGTRAVDRIRPKHHDAVVTVAEAARLLGVSSATIRSWMHRGHLVALPSSTARGVRIRLGDAIAAADARQLTRRAPKHLHGPYG